MTSDTGSDSAASVESTAPDADLRELHERIRALESSLVAVRSELESETRALGALFVNARKLSADRDALIRHSDDLRDRLGTVLGSRRWRLLEAPRAAVRALRRAMGTPAGVRMTVPAPPALKARRRLVPRPEEPARDVTAIARRDRGALLVKMREWERLSLDESSWVAYHVAMIKWCARALGPGFTVQSFEALSDKYGAVPRALRRRLGERTYLEVVRIAAAAMTRVGRYDDAVQLISSEIESGSSELRFDRAEISWSREPERAVEDIVAVLANEQLPPERRTRAERLLSHLDGTAVGGDDSADPQLWLTRANHALKEGRLTDQRDALNAYFDAVGRARPLADDAGAFSFESLVKRTESSFSDGPLVSVVMSTYNSSATLQYAVRSILEQTYSNLELIVVDDVSTDGTPESLAEIAQADPRVRLILPETNGGTYRNRNLAFRAARGEYVTFHDSDDWAHPERIKVHVDAMRAEPGLLATRSEWLRSYPDGRIEFRRWGVTLAHPNPASTFFSREVIDRIGDYDTVRFGADSEYWKRAVAVFGSSAIRDIRETLGFGLLHEQSLTQRGAGAWSEDHHSAARAQYTCAFTVWHLTSELDRLRVDAESSQREFWAPPAMLSGPRRQPSTGSLAQTYPVDGTSAVLFAIVAESSASGALIEQTLASLTAQTDGHWRAIVVVPSDTTFDAADGRVAVVDAAEPLSPRHQIAVAAQRLRALGGGHLCILDAGTLVHEGITAELRNHVGQTVEIARGLVVDPQSGAVAECSTQGTLGIDDLVSHSRIPWIPRRALPVATDGASLDGPWELPALMAESHVSALPGFAARTDGPQALAAKARVGEGEWRSFVDGLAADAEGRADVDLTRPFGAFALDDA